MVNSNETIALFGEIVEKRTNKKERNRRIDSTLFRKSDPLRTLPNQTVFVTNRGTLTSREAQRGRIFSIRPFRRRTVGANTRDASRSLLSCKSFSGLVVYQPPLLMSGPCEGQIEGMQTPGENNRRKCRVLPFYQRQGSQEEGKRGADTSGCIDAPQEK